MDIDVPKAHLHFEKLFGDNEEFNKRTDTILNENVQSIIAELKPVIQKIIGAFGFGIINKIYDKYSFDDLFPNP